MPSVLVPLANGSEELEAVSLVNVLRRCGVDVTLASVEGDTLGGAPIVKGSRGTRVVCDGTLAEADRMSWDAIALVGGLPGTRGALLPAGNPPCLVLRARSGAAPFLLLLCTRLHCWPVPDGQGICFSPLYLWMVWLRPPVPSPALFGCPICCSLMCAGAQTLSDTPELISRLKEQVRLGTRLLLVCGGLKGRDRLTSRLSL